MGLIYTGVHIEDDRRLRPTRPRSIQAPDNPTTASYFEPPSACECLW